jgi:hypothetical protein
MKPEELIRQYWEELMPTECTEEDYKELLNSIENGDILTYKNCNVFVKEYYEMDLLELEKLAYNSKGQDIGTIIAFALIQRVAATKKKYPLFLFIKTIFIVLGIYIIYLIFS